MTKDKESFILIKPFEPAGDQPEAIGRLSKQRPGKSVLLGVTGSGKTFTLANVIAGQHKNVLILSPNKTLAAQLYEEFSLFFPENKVCYFVSYYDYYQPESYLPSQDIYIPKETKINTEIERLRIETTASIINRSDVIVIASVSAIYSLGNPKEYKEMAFSINIGDKISRKTFIERLVLLQYKRNDTRGVPGTFFVVGNLITINIPYLADNIRVELCGDIIELIEMVDKREQTTLRELDNFLIFPAKHFVTSKENLQIALEKIKSDLAIDSTRIQNPLYRERLLTRVTHDINMISETGYCSGIENYSRYFDGRQEGEPPYTLFDFFGDNFLLIIDESHITIPQLHAMYKGDRARKEALIEYGFRLRGSFDNRPLKFEEIEKYFKDIIFVSATPGSYELTHSDHTVEQIIRPTGIVDPKIEIKSRINQMSDLIKEISTTTALGFRSLVTVLTKRGAEDLAKYLEDHGIKVCYMHSEIKTPQRTELLHKLRAGIFDCLVGINLLREGLDLPEVALVAIMDADIEGFLRNDRSIIQTIGRAARNTCSKILMYADKITDSMQRAISETERRRTLQQEYNKTHGIAAQHVHREVTKSISSLQQGIMDASSAKKQKQITKAKTVEDAEILIEQYKAEMKQAAEDLNFDKAIDLRDRIFNLQKKFMKN